MVNESLWSYVIHGRIAEKVLQRRDRGQLRSMEPHLEIALRMEKRGLVSVNKTRKEREWNNR